MTPLREGESLEEERIRIEEMRKLTTGQKCDLIWKLTYEERLRLWAEERRKYPDAPEEEIRMRVYSCWVPPDLMIRAYGWDPKAHGIEVEFEPPINPRGS
jgi:hypothetical protein